MDQELDKLNTFALNIAYSTMVQDRFASYLSQYGRDDQLEDVEILGDILTALIQPNRTVDQLNLYTNDGRMVASGLINGQMSGDPTERVWYQDVAADEHHKALIYKGEDPLLAKYFSSIYGKRFVTYAMRIYDGFNNATGYLEIKKNLSSILSAASAYHSVYGESVYVFDGEGTLLFPLDAAVPEELYAYAASASFPTEATRFTHGDQADYLFCAPSRESAFSTILVISQDEVLGPVYDYAWSILFITLCTLALVLILAYFAARRITTPISEICREVSSFDLTKPQEPWKLKTNVNELQTLYNSFLDMQAKLRESMNKQLLLQNQDMQSRMLALQSQMNPHFLFNSLAAIQSMADEGMTSEIQVMCQSMSNILRYISSSSSQSVPLRDELLHTKDYLVCMMIRYQGDLSYDIEVPESMYDLQVPKLCVQLLVENAIKFSSTKRPPYRIRICGAADQHHYTLRICDNGPGFSQESLEMLRSKIAEIDRTGLLPSLEINGMGLLNIYIRYRILHGEHIIFRLENQESGGACITIGEVYDGTEVQSDRGR